MFLKINAFFGDNIIFLFFSYLTERRAELFTSSSYMNADKLNY